MSQASILEPKFLEPHVIEKRELPAFVIEIHDPECPCIPCDQARFDAEAAAATPEAEAPTPLLDAFCNAGWLAGLGMLIGSAIAFAYDAHGAWLALTTMFTGGR